ncbi:MULTISPECIES: response regulator transcription factor [Acetobacterium]|jgi:DNA-binding response OmpR family regulator|uniref:Stage 0 sporulation protein A homolog n=1 Tax=Acetobacterium malicum TaxID=52692 RepID=A0ABR6YY00_9FIRM|nr:MULTISPECIES: response regulator transcription factor [Acetobacterium]MBI4856025.1 response regulator transcription factor [Acetobacterium woodii]MBP8032096.1 response regulator transcription factor [Acetobacterium sp.]MBU4540444.1 response regulator transcription factor [Bacillota bacterium]PKM48119.1 MAG: DNA-binding response regulator [Firmicutes bacterium HGW-Firmicutes-6]PKM60618.1 MAG: DNA-binding response regulator [Firmicutes bacterium HGW-Firmicutes-4]
MRILFVEDEKKITDALQELCKIQNIDCDIANDGEEGLLFALNPIYDVIVLDIMLPIKSGIEILQQIRDQGINTPVLMLTAKGTIDDKVKGLDLGADDYLIKPFSAKELFARIRALGRRPDHGIKGETIVFEDVSFNTKKNILQTENKEFKLSVKEAKILEMLLKRPNQVFTREQILDRVWGFDKEVNENNIEIYVHNLRKKIVDTQVKIDTIRGVGYTLGKK